MIPRDAVGQFKWLWEGRYPVYEVEHFLHEGRISDDAFDLYMYVWANGCPRFSSIGGPWQEPRPQRLQRHYGPPRYVVLSCKL